FEATRDLDAILQTKIAAGNPPDVTAAPGIGTLIKLARAGKVVQLDDKLDTTQLNSNYGADWINLGKIDNKLITLYAWASLKGLVWYDPKAFSAKGYQVPKTWDELMIVQNKIKSDGGKPLCVALESQAVSGWPGSDWHNEVVLAQAGATAYDSWVKRGGGKIAINKQVSLSDYPDAISKSLAQVVVDTKIARYDAGDLMPSDMRNAYWSAVLKFAQDQSNLDTILSDLDKTQATA